MKQVKTKNSKILGTLMLVASVLLSVSLSSCKDKISTKLLSIEDAIKISNMDNMKDASAVMKENGYEQAEDNADFYPPGIVSYWYKDCEIYCGGINCYNTMKVDSESASSVAIIADGMDDVVKIQVYSEQAKEEYLNQIKSLGYKKVENADKDGDLYVNDSNTIKVLHRPDKKYYCISIVKQRNWGYHEYGVEDLEEDLERQGISL